MPIVVFGGTSEAPKYGDDKLRSRIALLEAALIALVDAVDEKDAEKIERALFVGRGLTF